MFFFLKGSAIKMVEPKTTGCNYLIHTLCKKCSDLGYGITIIRKELLRNALAGWLPAQYEVNLPLV